MGLAGVLDSRGFAFWWRVIGECGTVSCKLWSFCASCKANLMAHDVGSDVRREREREGEVSLGADGEGWVMCAGVRRNN